MEDTGYNEYKIQTRLNYLIALTMPLGLINPFYLAVPVAILAGKIGRYAKIESDYYENAFGKGRETYISRKIKRFRRLIKRIFGIRENADIRRSSGKGNLELKLD